MLSHSRPKNLDLRTIRLPLPGIVSILHRLSGALLFALGVPVMLMRLDQTLHPESPSWMVAYVPASIQLALLWLLTWAFCHHFCAGLRFLLLDIHRGVDIQRARQSSVAVLVVSLLLTVLMGVWLW